MFYYDITVGIPVKNGIDEIENLIRSLFDFQKSKIFVHVSDNKSTDGTINKLRNLEKEYKNLLVTYQNEDIGEVRNFYFILEIQRKNPKSKYFCWMSHDDIRPHYALDKMMNHLEVNKNLIGVSSLVKRVTEDGKEISPFKPFPLLNQSSINRLSKEWERPFSTKFYSLFVLNELPKALDMYKGDYHDQIYLDRVIAKGKIDVINEILFIYREKIVEGKIKRRKSNCKYVRKLPSFINKTFYKYNHLMLIFENIKLCSSLNISIFRKLYLILLFNFYFIRNKIDNSYEPSK
tara:strand:+ start:552 stop:1424 length:873 start_codon:yes stop_codon:yes gene_type:complete